MSIPTVQVRTETERPYKQGDVKVRALAGESRLNDGKPLAGFFVRRRYHGEEFFIRTPKEFSTKWMEFVDTPPDGWVEQIKKRHPEWEYGESEYLEPKRDEIKPMSGRDLQENRMSSSDFDYSNGQPRRRGRPRKQQSE